MNFEEFKTLNYSKQYELFELLNLNEETKKIFKDFKDKQNLLLLKRKNKLHELFGIKYRLNRMIKDDECFKQYLNLEYNKQSVSIREDIFKYARQNNLWIDNYNFKLDENLKLIFDVNNEIIDDIFNINLLGDKYSDMIGDIENLYDYF
jgi:hypothetical protein